MTAADLGGLLLLLVATVIAVAELLATAYVLSLPPVESITKRERPSSLPAHYIVGSTRDPFAVDYERFRR